MQYDGLSDRVCITLLIYGKGSNATNVYQSFKKRKNYLVTESVPTLPQFTKMVVKNMFLTIVLFL